VNIAACAGSFAGSIMEADAICAAGWHVCDGSDIVDSGLTKQQGRSFEGCYVCKMTALSRFVFVSRT